MTVHKQLDYGPLAGAVSLRQEIAIRATRAFQAARRLRAMIVITAAIVCIIQIAAYAEILSSSAWVNSRAYPLTLGFLGATLFASAHLWCCRQRMESSQENLARYLSRIPSAFSGF